MHAANIATQSIPGTKLVAAKSSLQERKIEPLFEEREAF
jgi:hypothetical protein